jgi:outer membrane protein
MRKQSTAHSEQCVGAALAATQGGGKPLPYPCFALVIFLGLLTGPVAAETIKLDADAVAARVVEVSHVAAAAAARLSATQESVKAADAAALPSLSLSASVAQRSSVPEFAAPINGPLQPPVILNPDITTTYGTSLRLQQALYSGGAITGQREATRHDGHASAANLTTAVADLRLSAQLAYWEAVRAAASVGVARAQEERAKRLLDDTQALFDAGMAVNADVLAARERIASAQVQLIVEQTQADNSLARLRSLLEIGPADRVELADSLGGPLPSPPGTAEELQRQALAARPELAASAAQIAALRSRQEVAGAQVRPSVGAVAQLDYGLPNLRYFPQQAQWNDSWSVGLLASWTLFDGGKARADTAAVQFTERAAMQERDELTRRILLEVENDRRTLESALAAVLAADAARAAGIEREKEAQERHAAGLAPMADILDAQAQLAGAEQQQMNVRAGSWMAAAVLARAAGQ